MHEMLRSVLAAALVMTATPAFAATPSGEDASATPEGSATPREGTAGRTREGRLSESLEEKPVASVVGTVVSLAGKALTIATPDGSRERLEVDPTTRYLAEDGSRIESSAVVAGRSVAATYRQPAGESRKVATLIRVLRPHGQQETLGARRTEEHLHAGVLSEVGVVERIEDETLVLRTRGGEAIRFRITPSTKFFSDAGDRLERGGAVEGEDARVIYQRLPGDERAAVTVRLRRGHFDRNAAESGTEGSKQ